METLLVQTGKNLRFPQRKRGKAPVTRLPCVTQRGKGKGAFGSAYTLISPRPLETFAACLPAVYDGVPDQRREI